eukprot:6183408-Pleurochrysis_carterae.AAC.1
MDDSNQWLSLYCLFASTALKCTQLGETFNTDALRHKLLPPLRCVQVIAKCVIPIAAINGGMRLNPLTPIACAADFYSAVLSVC